ncbi:MAG: hypothetical protein DI535_18700 [Citrobacter freundii]|nr:MAG: hypothetical protein DI535_18700 [Citrobacter freundii]
MKFSFSFELNRKDFVDFFIYNYMSKRIRGSIISLVIILLLINLVIGDTLKFEIWQNVLFSAVFLGLMIFSTRSQLTRAAKQFKENGPMLCYKTVEFTEEHFSSSDWYSTSQTRWQAVSRVGVSKKAVYIFLDGYSGYIIPDRAFQTAQEKTDFVEFVKNRLAVTRGEQGK